jgi:hypothetical protein
MTHKKRRLTVTVDPELVDAGQRAVETGQADSVSAWVTAALEDKIRRDRKLALLGAAVADFELEFGEITAAEMVAQQRVDRAQAVVVRGNGGGRNRTSRSA